MAQAATNKRQRPLRASPAVAEVKSSCVKGSTGDLEEGEVVGERDHDVAVVLREALEGVKRRDDEALGLGEDSEEAKHGSAAVVDLDTAAALLLLLGLLGEDAKGVVEVKGDLAEALALDGRVEAREAALGVVHVLGLVHASALAVGLEHANEDKDLELAVKRDVIPLLLRGHVLDVAAVREHGVRALHDVGAASAEAEEASHGDAAVLDLSVAKVADGALLTEAPEVKVGGAEGIPEANSSTESIGVGLSEVDEVSLAVEAGLGAGDRSRGEGGGDAESEGEDELVHVAVW